FVACSREAADSAESCSSCGSALRSVPTLSIVGSPPRVRLPANPNPPPSSRPDVLLADHGNTVEREYFVLFENLGLALVPGAFAGVMYIALEPYVRWRWPQLLIGWIRVLTGHLRD